MLLRSLNLGKSGAPLYGTRYDEAIFWSGCSKGMDATQAAEAIAKTLGGTTLELLIRMRGIQMPPWDASSPTSVQLWAEASQSFAISARGRTMVVLGCDMRPGNIWETVELPALKANPHVREIVRIDPVTRAETIIHQKSEG